MTVTGVKMEFAGGMRDGVRPAFGRAARMDEEVELETMSLGELMYYALVVKA